MILLLLVRFFGGTRRRVPLQSIVVLDLERFAANVHLNCRCDVVREPVLRQPHKQARFPHEAVAEQDRLVAGQLFTVTQIRLRLARLTLPYNRFWLVVGRLLLAVHRQLPLARQDRFAKDRVIALIERRLAGHRPIAGVVGGIFSRPA